MTNISPNIESILNEPVPHRTSSRHWHLKPGGAEQLIEHRARQTLETHPHFRGRSQWVRCRCRQGRMVLTGELPSYYLKQLAQEAVRRVPGVSQIENRIRVSSPQAFVVEPPRGNAGAGNKPR